MKYGSATLVINEKVQALWESGKNVFHFGFGESRFPVHPRMINALANNGHRHSYVSLQGIPELREYVSNFYNKHFNLDSNADQIILGVGSKSLLYAVMHSLPGDVILPTPAWVSYKDQAKLAGRRFITFPLDYDSGYQVSIDALDEARKRTSTGPCMIVLTNPNNPTGTILSEENVKEVAEYCSKNDIYILSDEIYSLLTHDKFSHASPATYNPDGTVVLGGLSKVLSLGGWRIGVGVVPNNGLGDKIIDGFRHVAGSIWSCVPAPMQYAALSAYEDNKDISDFMVVCRQMHQIRTHYLFEQLTQLGIPCHEPQGGFYIYPHFKPWEDALKSKGISNDQELCVHLLDHYEIATLSGSEFLDDTTHYSLRLASSYIDAEDDDAGKRLLNAYSENADPLSFIQDHHPRMQAMIERMGEFIASLN